MTDELQIILQRLDTRIEHAIATANDLYGTAVGQDPYRGLYISPNDVELLLNRKPLVPLFSPDDSKSSETTGSQFALSPQSALQQLQNLFGLSTFELDIIVIALAPEIDPRYEQLYGYLHDNVQCRRPSINLALDLLCTSASDKLARRACLSATAPLITHGLVHLVTNPNQTVPSLLGKFLTLDAQVVNFLLGENTLDSRLTPYCQYQRPEDYLEDSVAVDDTFCKHVVAMASSRKQKLYFQGCQHWSQLQTAGAISADLESSMLVVDLDRLLHNTTSEQLSKQLAALKLAVLFHPAIFYGHKLAKGWLERPYDLKQLLEVVSLVKPVTIVSGDMPLPTTLAADWLTITFDLPPFSQRRRLWQQALQQSGLDNEVDVSATDIEALADRFILGVEQIRGAVVQAHAQGLLVQHTEKANPISANHSTAGRVTKTELFTAARNQSSQDLNAFTQKITPIHHWQHLILPDDTTQQLRELCAQVHHRHTVFDKWGYGQRLSVGKGLNALFSGPPGTGKTTAAEVIAQELQLDLYKINLSQVVSKYIGETEKNLDRIFTAARTANAILLFDEADALFGKRSEVRDAHDRYANIEISYLLQKMEAYDGISILTTNLRQNLDEAFVRRLAFIVHFPAPDEAHRRKIWSCMWPQEVPLADDLDFDWLAQQFKLSGGNIKNIALAAAFLSAEEDGPVTMSNILQAVQREYQKMGQTLTTSQLVYPSELGSASGVRP